MMRKRILFISKTFGRNNLYQQALQELDAELYPGTVSQARSMLSPRADSDLVVYEALGSAAAYLEEIESLVEAQGCPLLVIVEARDAGHLRYPMRVPCDFVIRGARPEECFLRAKRLMGNREEERCDEVITIDSLSINLAMYRVSIAGEPVDLTYLEYTLLLFFVQHPNQVFSRDALLENVWGFDYFGGPRTVDVHVRRIRAKLGPLLAQRIETVRGIGYLWNSR